MFDHIQLKVKDLKSSQRFYTAALAPLGFTLEYEGDEMIGFGPKGAPALWLGQGESRGPVHIAFAAKDRAAVRAFYAAALPAGGKDNGEPGLRPKYSANYYGGFVKDPDGNNIEAVCHQEE
jgi:catechol 2,3-dioxygenase-like lactoylglutathione lyase family enzyme